MAVKDKIRKVLPESDSAFAARTKLPDDVKAKTGRAKERTKKESAIRDQAWEFWRGNQLAYLNDKGVLKFLNGGMAGVRQPGKPSWRSRLSVNLFRKHCEQQVANATQRVPSYDVIPSTTDSEDITAAHLARKAAQFGHEHWNITDVTSDVVRHAVVGDEGFAWPFWDSSVGPFVDDGEGGVVGLGEVNIRVFGANQVGWEPGLKFEESPYHYVEYACPPEKVKEFDGFLGGEITPDADVKGSDSKLTLVMEYLERPCAKYPLGRWLTVANGRLVAGKTPGEGDKPQWRAYPCAEYEYTGIVLHRLTRFQDSDSDRGQGLGRDLVDPMRVFNDCMNRLVEWKNTLLVPRGFISPGFFSKQKFTGAPGEFLEVSQPNENVKLMDTPEAPRTIFEIADRAANLMAEMASASDPPSGVESAKAFQVWDERQKVGGFAFYKHLAEWYAGVMTHCLYLMQKHYTEERLLKVRGSAGWEPIEDFLGADLRSQVDVRVMPDSVEPLTRQAIEQKIMFYAQQQWITPERAMQAIEYGTADKLIEDIQNDYRRVNAIIQAIKKGPEALFNGMGHGRLLGVNPGTGEPEYEPGWMPRPFDNLQVQKYVFETWLKSDDFDRLPDEMREAAWVVYDGFEKLEAEKQMKDAMAQQQMAEGLGMANAAAPQGPSPLPDQPAVPGGNPLPTANQPDDQALPSGA